mmetsp:Transcript_28130/g.71967  ORF Transcript_28130/g.71967 Transcript_28130/m.71967 type:complete len:229 (-) Transcript_28130:559-1245(-)
MRSVSSDSSIESIEWREWRSPSRLSRLSTWGTSSIANELRGFAAGPSNGIVPPSAPAVGTPPSTSPCAPRKLAFVSRSTWRALTVMPLSSGRKSSLRSAYWRTISQFEFERNGSFCMRFISLRASVLSRSATCASIVSSSWESSTKRSTARRGLRVEALMTSVHTTIIDVCSRMRPCTPLHAMFGSFSSAGHSRSAVCVRKMSRPSARPTAPRSPPHDAMRASCQVQP